MQPNLNNRQWQTNPLLQTRPTTPAPRPAAPTPPPAQPAARPTTPTSAPVRPPVAPQAPLAPVPTPTPQPLAEATPAAVYGPELGAFQPDEFDTALADMARQSRATATSNVDEDSIYRNKLAQYQQQIDAVNQLYREKLRVEGVAGQGRLGTGRAIQGRSGLLGSDFASAQNDTIGQMNNEILSGIQGEQAMAVQAILGQARRDAQEEVTAKRAAKEQGAESYLRFLGEQSQRRSGKLEAFLGTLGDTDLSKVSPTNLAEVARSYGITVDELKARAKSIRDANEASARETDLKTRKTEADIARLQAETANAGFFNLSEGQARFDAAGNLVASRGKTFAPSRSGTTTTNQSSNENIAKVDQLLETRQLLTDVANMKGKSAAVGFGFGKSVLGSIPFVSGNAISGTARKDFEVAATRLSDMFLVQNLGKMSGVLTDKDLEVLRSEGTTIGNFDQSEAAWLKEKERLDKMLRRGIAQNGITVEQAVAAGDLSPDDETTLESLWETL